MMVRLKNRDAQLQVMMIELQVMMMVQLKNRDAQLQVMMIVQLKIVMISFRACGEESLF